MSNDDTGLIPWILAGVGGIVSALLTGVITLFRMREADNTKQLNEHKAKIDVLEVEVDTCKTERAELFTRCEVNSERLVFVTEKVKHLESVISKIDKNGTQHSQKLS